MKKLSAALGYVVTVALAAGALHWLYSSLLHTWVDTGSAGIAAMCGGLAAGLAWPRVNRSTGTAGRRVIMEVSARTAGIFYLSFTAMTVGGALFAEYVGQADGALEAAAIIVLSLPLAVLFSTGAMIYLTAGAAFFASLAAAAVWVRVARRIGA